MELHIPEIRMGSPNEVEEENDCVPRTVRWLLQDELCAWGSCSGGGAREWLETEHHQGNRRVSALRGGDRRPTHNTGAKRSRRSPQASSNQIGELSFVPMARIRSTAPGKGIVRDQEKPGPAAAFKLFSSAFVVMGASQPNRPTSRPAACTASGIRSTARRMTQSN